MRPTVGRWMKLADNFKRRLAILLTMVQVAAVITAAVALAYWLGSLAR